MADSRRGKKINTDKNPAAREAWMKAKKVGRPKQENVEGKWVKNAKNWTGTESAVDPWTISS